MKKYEKAVKAETAKQISIVNKDKTYINMISKDKSSYKNHLSLYNKYLAQVEDGSYLTNKDSKETLAKNLVELKKQIMFASDPIHYQVSNDLDKYIFKYCDKLYDFCNNATNYMYGGTGLASGHPTVKGTYDKMWEIYHKYYEQIYALKYKYEDQLELLDEQYSTLGYKADILYGSIY